jgi:hypothetical protein
MLFSAAISLACSSDNGKASSADGGPTDGGGGGAGGRTTKRPSRDASVGDAIAPSGGGSAGTGATTGGASGSTSAGGTTARGTGGSGGRSTSSGGAGTTSAGGVANGGTSAGSGGVATGGSSAGSGGAAGGEPRDAGDSGPPSGGVSDSGADAAPPGLPGDHVMCDGGDHGCPEPMAHAAMKPWMLAVDTDHIYFTSSTSNGELDRIPIGGGDVETIEPALQLPTYLAVAGGNVFWVDAFKADGQMYPGRLMQASVTGGQPLQLATTKYTGIASITSDGTNVYYWDNYNQVFAAPVGGGTVQTLFGGIFASNIVDMVRYGSNLYWTNSGTFNSTFTQKIPLTANIDRMSVTLQKAPELIVPGLNFPLFQLTADGAHVFYNDDRFIYRTGAYGGGVKRVVELPPGTTIVDMISDGANLYFTNGRLVYRAPVDGGESEIVSWGWQGLQSLAVDANHLYFCDTAGGFVVQANK